MSQTLEATFDGEVFRPTEAVELKPDSRVRLIVTDESTAVAFEEWQSLLTANEEDDSEAIQQALDEMDAGDHGTPWSEFDKEFRQKHTAIPIMSCSTDMNHSFQQGTLT
jgi:predicted DNA-binding antitoxin AbrB/MazE fold protein